MMGTFSQPVVPITANSTGSGFGGNGDALWIFALLVLFGGGGFGGLGNRGGAVPEVTGYQLGELAGKVATKDSITMLQNSTNQGFAGLSAQSANETMMLQNSSNQGFAGLNTVVQTGLSAVTIEIANRIAALSAIVTQCCCDIKQQMAEGFGQVRYDMANFAAQTNANIADWGNKILMDNARRAESAKDQLIADYRLQAALCGIPKVSNSFTYPAPNPYSINNCNGY